MRWAKREQVIPDLLIFASQVTFEITHAVYSSGALAVGDVDRQSGDAMWVG